MSDGNRHALRVALSTDYENLVRRLTRFLGSSELAREALHETFLRVSRVSEAVAIESPNDYLLRTAINVAKDRRKSDRRLLTAAEIESICDLPDQTPDPSVIAESRLELEELGKALGELPARRGEIFLAAHVEHIPHRDIARRFGVSERTVGFELRRAMEHLGARLGRKVIRRFGPRPKGAAPE